MLNYINKLRNGDTCVEDEIATYFEKINKIDSQLSCFNTLTEDYALARARFLDKELLNGRKLGKLAGLPISVKDNICTKGIPTTCSSEILKNYAPPFNATAFENVENEGGILIGKTSMDVFGFGTFATNHGSSYPTPKNPIDPERSAGGSSGGSGAITKAVDFPHLSLAESTGGSITAPSSFCGVVGYTPTYGLVSRYGLIDYASSLDKIGVMGKSVEETKFLAEVIAKPDPKDQSMYVHNGLSDYSLPKKPRIGLIKEVIDTCTPEVSKSIWASVKKLESKGINYEEISIPSAPYALYSYYILATAEASTNLAKFTGLRYGATNNIDGGFSEYFSSVREKYFSEEEKRRIIIGTFVRSAGYRGKYYLKAKAVREKIRQDFSLSLKKLDALITPSMPIIAPRFSEISSMKPHEIYALDICTAPPDLLGIPHLSIPSGKINSMPVGLQVMTDTLEDSKLFSVGRLIEEYL